MPTVAAEKSRRHSTSPSSACTSSSKEGLPKEGRGQFDPMKCMLWYVRYLQRAIEKKAVPTLDSGFVGERKERVRLLSADADLKEIELSKLRGSVITLESTKKRRPISSLRRGRASWRSRRGSRPSSSANNLA